MNISKSLSLFIKNAAQFGLKSALIVGLAFVLPGCGSSSDGGGLQGTNTLERSFEGTILAPDGSPQSGVSVTIEETGDTAVSNTNGYYVITAALDPQQEVTLLVETEVLQQRIEIAPQASGALEVNIQIEANGKLTATISPAPEKRENELVPEEKSPEVTEPTLSSPPRVRNKRRCAWNPITGRLRCAGGSSNSGNNSAPDPSFSEPNNGTGTPTEYTGEVSPPPKDGGSVLRPGDQGSEGDSGKPGQNSDSKATESGSIDLDTVSGFAPAKDSGEISSLG
jgi:hypothetical protein